MRLAGARGVLATGVVLSCFAAPAAPGAELLVADPGHDDIRRFDAITGAYLGCLGGQAGLLDSSQFDVGPDRSIYVAHFDFAKLVKLDGTTGQVLDSAELQGRPVHVRLGPDGLLYANLTTAAGEIRRYDPSTLDLVDALPVANHQGDFRFGPDGNLYVSNADSRTIDVYDVRARQYVDRDPATPARDPFARLAQGQSPGPIAFGPDGDLFAIDFRTIVRYDGQTGELLGDFVPAPPQIADPGPRSLAFGPDGNLYVGDHDGRIVRYSGDNGSPLGVWVDGPQLERVGAMVFVPEPGGAALTLACAGLAVARRRAAR